MKLSTPEFISIGNLIERKDILALQDGNHGEKHPKASDFSSDGVPFVMARDISSGKLNLNTCVRIPHSIYKKLRIGFATSGDVLLSHKGSVGFVAVVPNDTPEVMLTPQVTYHRLNPEGRLLNKYYAYALSSPAFQDQLSRMAAQSTRAYIGITAQKKLTVPVLKESEQKYVINLLETWDESIDLVNKLISAVLEEKFVLADQLFSSGKERPLKELCLLIKDGTHFSPKSKGGPFKYLTSKNIRFGFLDLNNVDTISGEEHQRIYSACPVIKGDVLLTKDGANTGNAAINELSEPFSLLSSVAVLRGKAKTLNNDYLLQYFLSPKGQARLKGAMEGQAITRLTLTKINDFKIPVIDFEKQVLSGSALSEIDRYVRSLRSLRDLYVKQKKGLLLKVFGGSK